MAIAMDKSTILRPACTFSRVEEVAGARGGVFAIPHSRIVFGSPK